MFKVNDLPILEDELHILEVLHDDLARAGLDLLRGFKKSGANIQFTCPIHNNGQERKPSCGISLVDHGSTPAGTVHCFACGYTASLPEMISHCFGYDDQGRFGSKWLASKFLTVSVENRKELNLNFSRENSKTEQFNYVSEQELESYRYIHPYMFKRKLTEEIIELFDVGYDKNQQTLTFPVRDIQGRTLFIARRSVRTKYFHYPESAFKPIYGIYELPDGVEEVIICESIINCLTCWVYGKYAVALNGTGSYSQYKLLRNMPCRKFILALDPDEAGRKGTEKLKKQLSNKLVTQYVLPEGKDINDLTEEEFNSLEEIF